MKLIPRLTDISGLQFYQLLRYSVLILTGILLAKSGIGQDAIGFYETFLMLNGAFTFFWLQGIMKAMMPMSANADDRKQGKLFFNVFVVLVGAAILSACALFFLNPQVSALLLKGKDVPAPLLLSVFIVVNTPALMVEYVYLLKKRPSRNVFYGLATFVLQIVLVGLPPLLGYAIHYSLYGIMALSVVRLVWLFVLLGKYGVWQFDKKLLAELLHLSWPLILSTLLSSSSQYIDGFIITSKFSQSEFAVFQYGARELPLAMLLANSLSVAMVPRFAQSNLSSPLAEIKSETYRLGVLLFPVTIVCLLLSHWAFPVFFNQGFAESATVFNVYLMLILSRLSFPQTILMGQRMNRPIVMASLFEIIVNVSTSIWFAGIFGIVGVAYGTFVAYVFEKIYLAVVVYRTKRIGINRYMPLVQYISFSMLLVVVFIVVEFVVY